jgi:predicted transcriptional regulator of viral defense system
MLFLEFKKAFNDYPTFSIHEIEKRMPRFNKMNLIRWQKKGYVQKIRSGWYCFTDDNRNETFNFLVANRIYAPSYISMESALSYYGFIPEGTFSTTSISTLKTNTFSASLGTFIYKSVKPAVFFGYSLEEHINKLFKIAEPEKALLDFLYFQKNIIQVPDIISFRFSKPLINEQIDRNTLLSYAEQFNSKVLLKKTKILIDYLDA